MSDRPRPIHGLRSGAAAPRLRLPLFRQMREPDPEEAGEARGHDPTLALRQAVTEDLLALLNARRRRLPPPPELVHLARSPIGYGIPDVTAGGYALEARRHELAREVEAIIRRFEPRLTEVSVTLRDQASEIDRTLRLRVEAVLVADPIREQISFETVVEPAIHDVSLREADPG